MKPGFYVGGLCLISAGTGIAFFVARRSNDELSVRITQLARQNADLRYELKQAGKQADAVGRQAVELDSLLGATKTRATATEAKNVQLVRELAQTNELLTGREQREVALMAELAALRERVAGGVYVEQPAGLPAPDPVTAISADELRAYRDRIAQLQGQLMQLLTKALSEPSAAPPASVVHQVVRVGPSEAFVVLDYGSEHGARLHALIRLQRGTSLLAQAQISDVRPRFSLAQIVPGTLKGQLQTGDLVVFNP